MRISDWSSDVCSSDRAGGAEALLRRRRDIRPHLRENEAITRMATRAPGRPLHGPDPATPDRSVGAASVITGFGLTMGLTIAWLSLIVLIPLSSIFLRAAGLGWADFVAAGFSPRAIAAYKVSRSGERRVGKGCVRQV